MRAALTLSTAALFLAACQTHGMRPAGSSQEAANDRDDSPAEAPAASPDPKLPIPPGKSISFDEPLKQVSDLRKLPIKGNVQGLEIKVGDLINHVQAAVELQTPVHALLGTEAMMVGLAVVPVDFDFKFTMLDLMGENLQGLYDPRLRMMLVRTPQNPKMRKITLAHELVHALQGQHFELEEIVEWSPDDTDVSSALSALAEGDATSAMLDATLPTGQTALDIPVTHIQAQFEHMSAGSEKSAPALIVRSLSAPYVDGVKFVHQLRSRGGFDELNRVWAHPPETTEQVLHLDKYDAQEAAVRVAVPPAPGECKELLHDVWGEQSLRLIFEEWMPAKDASEAAAGWGGDRIVAYECQGRIAVRWDIEADTEKDAKEMFAAFSASFDAEQKKDASLRCGHPDPSDQRVIAVHREAKTVHVAGGFVSRTGTDVGDCTEAQGWLSTRPRQPEAD